jgi:hypothetical protein
MKLRLPLFITLIFLLHIALQTTKAFARSVMDEAKAAEYKAVAPLNHTVRIERTGGYLMLDYELIGTDGKKYDLWEINDQSRPAFAIYQDNAKVGDGTFEFG